MYLSAHHWMRSEPIEKTISRLASLGFEAIQIKGEPAEYDPKQIRRLLGEAGVRCWGAVTIPLGDRNLAAKDEAQRARTVQYNKDVVDFAAEMGGEHITLVPVTVGKLLPDATPEAEWQWVVDGCREICEHANKRGIKVGIEPINRLEAYMIYRSDQAMLLAAEVGLGCGVSLDTFHLNIEEENLYASLEAAKGMLIDLHVADNNRLAPGMGSINWNRVVSALRDISYDGALTVEFVAPIDRTPASPFKNQVERNPTDISPDQLKFIQDHGSAVLTDEFFTSLMVRSAETLRPLIAG